MKVDALFYQLFQSFPHIFFELVGKPGTNASNYEFTSPEVKQPTFRFDGVLKPKTSTPDGVLYFIEVQFQKRPKFYTRLFAEINLYFNQYDPPYEDWYAVVIFKTRNIEFPAPPRYQELMERRVIRVYLDEIEEQAEHFLGVAILQLIAVTSKRKMGERAQRLLEWAGQRQEGVLSKEQAVELVQTIVLYRFPDLTQEEIEAMLGSVNLKKTRVYQEIREEVHDEAFEQGKLAAVPLLLESGMTIEQIAARMDVPVAAVQKAAITALLDTDLTVEQIAERLGMKANVVRALSIEVLMSKKNDEVQIALRLGITPSAVRRISRQQTRSSEAN